jgi:hypothetical protein
VARQDDSELVDCDVFAAFEHVDADDVASDGTDARRDQAQRTRPVGQPHPHKKVRHS